MTEQQDGPRKPRCPSLLPFRELLELKGDRYQWKVASYARVQEERRRVV